MKRAISRSCGDRRQRCSRTRRSRSCSAPYESTMGLVQKIFYFHVPSWMVMFSSAFVCGIGSAHLPVLRAQDRRSDRRRRRRSSTVVFGLDRPGHRPALGAQGVGRVVAVGCPAHVRAGDVADLRRLPAAAAVRRARVGEAGGGRGALRHGQRAVRLLVGERLADGPSRRRRWSRRCSAACAGRSGCARRVHRPVRRSCSRRGCGSRSAGRSSMGCFFLSRTDDEDRAAMREKLRRAAAVCGAARGGGCSRRRSWPRSSRRPSSRPNAPGRVSSRSTACRSRSSCRRRRWSSPPMRSPGSLVFGYVWTIWQRLGRVEREIADVSRRVDAGARR